MKSSTTVSLAILKVNWDFKRKDYLENFVPIVAESIRLSQDEVISTPKLQEHLRTQFGLRLPQSAIKAILSRARKRGYIRSENNVYRPENDNLVNLRFYEIQQQVIRMHEHLIESLIAFCLDRFGVTWNTDDAEAALQSYLQDNELVLMNAATSGNLIPVADHHVKSAKFFVGSFVQHIQENHSSDLDYLETVVKGNMLANAIFLPDPSQALKKFRKTEIYFDTSFLMFALGYAGQPRQEPCTELLHLLYETGACLRCFTHTLDEIRGILYACAHRIGQGQLRHAYGPSVEYFLSKGYTASDIELFAVRLERNLEALRVRVADKPAYAPQYVIDEQGFSVMLANQISYRNPEALWRDVASISAVMRLSKGRSFFWCTSPVGGWDHLHLPVGVSELCDFTSAVCYRSHPVGPANPVSSEPDVRYDGSERHPEV